MQTQAQETDCQHNHNGLNQHLHKLVDRAGHRTGLILHLQQLHPGRQLALQAVGHHFQGLAQGHDVATLIMGNAQTDAFFPWWRTLTIGGSV